MSVQTSDVHLLRRLSQLESDLDGMCSELQRRRSPRNAPERQEHTRKPSPTKASEQEGRPRSWNARTHERNRNISPKPQLARSPSRGDRRRPPRSASTNSLHGDHKLSAVLEIPPAERRVGASREDCGNSGDPRSSDSDAVKLSSIEFPRATRGLVKSQSTTSAGLASSSSGSCLGLSQATSSALLANLWLDPSCDGHTPRCSLQAEPFLSARGLRNSQTLMDRVASSAGKSSAGPVERIDLGDPDSLRADAERDLVWQLELERLRNATLKLEVQRELSESSDLRKRLIEAEIQPGTPGKTRLLVPAVPAVRAVPTVPVVSAVPSMSRLPIAKVPNLSGSVQACVKPMGMQHLTPVPDAVLTTSTSESHSVQQQIWTGQRPMQLSPRQGNLCHRVSTPALSPRLN